MKKIMFFDSTLRDGNHAVRHQLTKENICNYCQVMDGCGVEAVFVGHGNGLGASSLQVGLAGVNETDMLLSAKRNLKKTNLGTYMIPGFGTIEDNLKPAIKSGVDVFEIGCHCTEADVTREHIKFLRYQDKRVYGVLMMTHMASPKKLLEQCRLMEDYGAQGVILMDSAGAYTMERTKCVIATLVDKLEIDIGFHSHNNLGIAVANAYIALSEGANIIDGTVRGFGAGAGNCQIEEVIALLEKNGKKVGINLEQILDCSEKVMPTLMKKDMGEDAISIVSGQSGVFSAFRAHAIEAGKTFGVNPREILRQVGKRKAVAGQEDMIVEIARDLQNIKEGRV